MIQNRIKGITTKKTGRKRVFIFGDSILKHVNGNKITEKLGNCKDYVYILSGSEVNCMEDYYAQATNRSNPDHMVIHIDTNNLPSKKRVSKNYHHYRRLIFETKIRHLSGFSFKSNKTK